MMQINCNRSSSNCSSLMNRNGCLRICECAHFPTKFWRQNRIGGEAPAIRDALFLSFFTTLCSLSLCYQNQPNLLDSNEFFFVEGQKEY